MSLKGTDSSKEEFTRLHVTLTPEIMIIMHDIMLKAAAHPLLDQSFYKALYEEHQAAFKDNAVLIEMIKGIQLLNAGSIKIIQKELTSDKIKSYTELKNNLRSLFNANLFLYQALIENHDDEMSKIAILETIVATLKCVLKLMLEVFKYSITPEDALEYFNFFDSTLLYDTIKKQHRKYDEILFDKDTKMDIKVRAITKKNCATDYICLFGTYVQFQWIFSALGDKGKSQLFLKKMVDLYAYMLGNHSVLYTFDNEEKKASHKKVLKKELNEFVEIAKKRHGEMPDPVAFTGMDAIRKIQQLSLKYDSRLKYFIEKPRNIKIIEGEKVQNILERLKKCASSFSEETPFNTILEQIITLDLDSVLPPKLTTEQAVLILKQQYALVTKCSVIVSSKATSSTDKIIAGLFQSIARNILEKIRKLSELQKKSNGLPTSEDLLVAQREEIDIDSSHELMEPLRTLEHGLIDNQGQKFFEPDTAPLHESILEKAKTDLKIALEPQAREILTKLNKKGYWAYVVGGYVRDKLKGVEPHDSDIITNCPKEMLATILGKPCYSVHPQGSLFKVGNDIDITCCKRGLKENLADRDITINTFLADAHGVIFDVLGKIKDLSKPNLIMLKNPEESFAEDPSRMTRLLRHASHLGMDILPLDMQTLKSFSDKLCSVPFGVYASEISKLFKRGKANVNLEKLIEHGLLPSLIGAQSTTFYDSTSLYFSFMRAKMSSYDDMPFNERKTLHPYVFISLILLPILTQEILEGVAFTDAMQRTLTSFCHQFKGKLTLQEEAKFLSIAPKYLIACSQEFYNYYYYTTTQLYQSHYIPQDGQHSIEQTAYFGQITHQYQRHLVPTETGQIQTQQKLEQSQLTL
ncbi:MAG: CCA tRNA nucleotidyltransferase [Proteobacteria bacterium]|nr:CCA tRNA nucleotidyltransferase [Pseudomonadota bacterium]